jgi:hypothetical protein
VFYLILSGSVSLASGAFTDSSNENPGRSESFVPARTLQGAIAVSGRDSSAEVRRIGAIKSPTLPCSVRSRTFIVEFRLRGLLDHVSQHRFVQLIAFYGLVQCLRG